MRCPPGCELVARRPPHLDDGRDRAVGFELFDGAGRLLCPLKDGGDGSEKLAQIRAEILAGENSL